MHKRKILRQSTVKITQAVSGRVEIGIQVSSVSGVAPPLQSLCGKGSRRDRGQLVRYLKASSGTDNFLRCWLSSPCDLEDPYASKKVWSGSLTA